MKIRMTIAQVVAAIYQNVKGTAIVSVDLDSDMDGKGKMRTTGNQYAGLGIVKRETLTGIIGYDYGKAVNRLAAKEGAENRNAKPHPWGDMDENSLFRIHRTNGKRYLSMKVQSANVEGFFLPDGTEVADELIRSFIPEKTKSSTQADLNGEVIARDYSLSNITGLRAFGMDIEIIPESQAAPDYIAPALPATVTNAESVALAKGASLVPAAVDVSA